MKELLRTNDGVLLSFAGALLRDAGIESIVLDAHTSILEGSIGAIPRRLMVAEMDHAEAKNLLDMALQAGENGPGEDGPGEDGPGEDGL